MIVIAKNAEKKLAQELALCRRMNRSLRGYYLPLSRLEDRPKEDVFVPLLTLFHQVRNSYMAQVFICADRDTFILISDLAPEDFNAFLKDFCQAVAAPEFALSVEAYEVGRDAEALEALSKKKLAQAEASQAEERRREQLAQAGKILEEMAEVSPEMLASLQQRRAERIQPQVLVVDDDQLCRSLAANVLGKRYSCAISRNSKDALQDYVAMAPDVLFLDIGLPDIDGFDLLEHLFGIDPHAYIIMFSGRKDKENILRAVEMGAQGFVGKPFTGQQLLEYVKKSPFVQEKEYRNGQGRQGAA